jgi:hypothetical protein
MRADVHVPLEDNHGVIARVLEDVMCTFAGEFVYTSASLFPQCGGGIIHWIFRSEVKDPVLRRGQLAV